MTATRRAGLIALVLGGVWATCACAYSARSDGSWPGVDESVVSRFARDAGRTTSHPVVDWVHGDALLFAFLCAGLLAGFVLGFFWRSVFGASPGRSEERGHA